MPGGSNDSSKPQPLAVPTSPICIKPPRHPGSPAFATGSRTATTPTGLHGPGALQAAPPGSGSNLGVEKSSASEPRLSVPLGMPRSSAQGASPPDRAHALLPSLARTSLEPHPAARHHRTVDIGTHTLAGTRYAGLNQDYLVVQAMYTPGEIPRGGQQTWILTVCDGHGILGDKSACFAGKALARHVYSSNLRNKHLSRLHHGEVETEMKAAFKKAHHSANLVYDMPPKSVQYPHTPGASKLTTYTLTDLGGIKTYRSEKGAEKMLECGTTCTAAIVQGRCVCLANVGDSLAVVGREVPLEAAADADEEEACRVTSEVVTVRHHGLLASERERIQRDHAATTRVLEDGYVKVLEGPYAGYELAVTRALGHKNMEPLGVLDDPHVVMLDMDPAHHCCLILASDGLWDVLQPDEAVQMAMEARRKGQSATQVAHALVEKAVDKGLEGSDEQDNTSAIVVFFNAGVQAPGSSGAAAAATAPLVSRPSSGPNSARHSGSGAATPPGTLPHLACASPGTPGSASGSTHE